MSSRWLVGLMERGKALFTRAGFEAELDEEIRFHVDEATERNVRRGMSPAEARRIALRDFGGVERVKEEVRTETGVRLLHDLAQDTRMAVRTLRRHAVFAGVVVLTVAVSVGAHGAVFGVVHSVLLNPLPFAESDRLVSVFNSYPAAGNPRSGNSVPHFQDWQSSVESLEGVALYTRSTLVLGEGDGARAVPALAVTPAFFPVLRTSPALGSGFRPEGEGTGGTTEAVITDELWRSTFGGSSDVVGSTVLVEGAPNTIVGVLPPGFRFSTSDPQIFTTLSFSPSQRSEDARHADWYRMLGRLTPGVSIAAAQDEIDALNRVRLGEYPPQLRREMDEAGFRTVVRPFLADLTREVRRPLFLLWAGVLTVLVIGAANVAALFLVRSNSRGREMATRLALGAGRRRLLRQLVTESTVLALIGGVGGLLLARWSLGLLGLFEVQGMVRAHEISLDGTVVVVILAGTVLLGLAAGTVPCLPLLRFRNDGLLHGRRGGRGRGSSTLHRGLVSGQIALAFVLMMGAALLVTSVRSLLAVDPGFDPAGVAVAALSLPDDRYPDESTRLEMTSRILGSIGQLPGVRSAAVADQLPFSGATPRVSIVPEGDDAARDDARGAPHQTVVSPGYFDALEIEILSGRGFGDGDDRAATRVAAVDETLARRFWADGNPLGRRVWRGRPGDPRDPSRALVVVGVVESIRQNDLAEADPAGAFYVPLGQVPLGSFRLALDLDVEASSVWPAVRAAVGSLDPGLVLSSGTSLDESVASSLALRRTPMRLLSAFALIGLFLGCVGVYGVIALLVSSREKELAVRKAVGGTPRMIASLIGREWGLLVGLGLFAGMVVAWGATRVIESLLYGTGTLEPRVVLSVTGALLASALVACIAPVRRALGVDPARVLRDD